MTARRLMLIAALGSAALIAGALVFQALGYAPCKMCLWQRWPHWVAIALGGVALVWARWPVAALGLAAALTTAGIGGFHTGVERGWWPGPSSCSGGGDLSGLSGADLLSVETVDKVVMCDAVAWSLAGLSMASWNMVLSLVLAGIWGAALMRARRS